MKPDLRLNLTPEQIAHVRARFDRAADGIDFYETFPEVRAALDKLPDVSGFAVVIQELRIVFFDGLREQGIALPRDVLADYGMESWFKKG